MANITKKRQLVGKIVSEKMKQTVVVESISVKRHRKYKKFYRVTRQFQAHDENSEYHVGDMVALEESRPMSKKKRWKVISKL